MIKTNDWMKSGTSNQGDETRYTLHGGWSDELHQEPW